MTQPVSTSPEFTFACPLVNGLHARPASHLSGLADDFASDCSFTNLRNGAVANAKSVLSIIAADVRAGDECRVRLSGADADAACATLRRFVEEDLPLCDEPLPEVATGGDESVVLPRALRSAGVSCYPGVAVSRGIGRGKVVLVSSVALPRELSGETATDPLREQERIARAVAQVRARIEAMLVRQTSATEAAILKAHLAMLTDVSLADKLSELIAQGRTSAQAVVEACEFFVAVLRQTESAYIRERAADVQDICLQLLEEIYGRELQSPAIELREPSVVVAETLAPRQLLSLDRRQLRALVLERASATSHVVILARSLGIPTLVEVGQAALSLSQGQEIIVDADRGLIIPQLTTAVGRFYERELRTLRRRQDTLSRYATAPAMTADGQSLEVAANVSSAGELTTAFERGADGVGLFRTEMLFVGRDSAPTEEEQFEVYAEAARAGAGRAVVIRMFDVGGDKPLPYLHLPREANPFLGYRGARLYAEHLELFRTQLRAILRASAFGRVWLMIPMISSIEEVGWVKAQIAEVRGELKTEGISFDPLMRFGIMCEVPSVAFILEELCAEVDFFSVGTNDLCQYFFAADRDNAKVSVLSDVRRPGFLRFLRQIVCEVRARGKWVGMCGEMAGDARNLPLLLGMGLDEISVASSEIPTLKERISRLSAGDCEQLLARAVACRGVGEVEALLEHEQSSARERPLLDRELVIIESESESKEEAIRELVDALYIAGRTRERERLEDGVWAREAVYSTGLGHGFAIPHCKSNAVADDSICVLKLKEPVEWGALDAEPVSVVILLAMRESDATANRHMQVFARLARKLMDEDFRERLLSAEDAASVLTHLASELEIAL
ncbi:MAG: multiphosphoryl transfer protein [Acidobacteriota bacterium]|nr:multiphosphoryl transfer protein [Acidobacteriota bacterium]